MYEKVLVPDCLPNNLRAIREMRGYSVKDLASDIHIDRNFLSAVEQQCKNFSGKTTITTLAKLGINFYRMYDVNETRVCQVTDDFPVIVEKEFIFDFQSFIHACSSKNNKERVKDVFFIDIDKKILAENTLFNAKLEEVIQENKHLDYFDFDLISKIKSEQNIALKVNFIFTKKEVRNVEFDIRFAENENIELTDELFSLGFNENIVTWEQLIDNEKVRIDGTKLILDSEYKIPRSEDINDYYITNELDLSNVIIKEEKDELRGGHMFKYAKFKAIRPAINNLRILRNLLNLSIEEMHSYLGLKYAAYLNMELGNQKISLKTMWRLVYKFKIPLEVIVNVHEYYKRHCLFTKKIILDNRGE